MHLFDTHTHFDVADFDEDRQQLALEAKKVGVDALVLIGFLQSRFDDLVHTHHQLKQWENVPTSYLAPGLHPFYIEQHRPEHLSHLEQILQQEDCVAVGEIGLDTFLKEHKQPDIYTKQTVFCRPVRFGNSLPKASITSYSKSTRGRISNIKST